MKASGAPSTAGSSALLAALFVLSWGSLFALARLFASADELPTWTVPVGWVGVAAATVLVLTWLLRGVLGYERTIGLRIIRAERVPRGSRPLCALCWVTAAAALILLNLGQHSLALVVTAAAASLFGLLLLLVQFSSIFGTTSIAGVLLGVAALIVVQSVATGFQHAFERRVLGVYAHINVTRSVEMTEYRRFEAYLRGRDGVIGASPFIYHLMMLAPHDPEAGRTDDLRLASVLAKGIEPATAAEVIDLPAHLLRGSGREIPLGALRSDFELMPVPDRVPDELPPVIAETPDPRGAAWYEPAMERYAAVPAARKRSPGELRSELSDDDAWPEEPLVYLHIKELQRFKYRGRDQVSGVDLRLRHPDLAPQVGGAIKAVLPGREYAVLEWQKLNENLFKSIRLQKNIITVILSLVITVATFNVLSALWTMVVRRTADVAILMSMGATGPQVARVFQVTGMAIGLSGAAAGVLFGLLLCWLVALYGYTLDPEVYFIEELPVEISLVQIGWILGMTLGICFLATLLPSLRAAKLRPVEGLRYE